MAAPTSSPSAGGGWRLSRDLGAGQPGIGRRDRPWPAISWSWSLGLFAVAVALLLGTYWWQSARGSAPFIVTITDRVSGQPLAGVTLVDGSQVLTTDANGLVSLPAADQPRTVAVRLDRYAPVSIDLPANAAAALSVALRPSTVEGRVFDARNQAPVAGAAVAIVTEGGGGPATTTAADGTFLVADVPEGGQLRVETPDHDIYLDAIGDRTRIDVPLTWSVVIGVVRDVAGAPVAGARVGTIDGAATTLSGDDGSFRLTGVAQATELLVRASGFADLRLAISPERRIDATVELEQIKAVYANFGTLVNRERYQSLIDLADTTEVNAIVIDVKQDTIYYDTAIPFFRAIDGMVTPVFDPATLLAELEAHSIYAIARMVVFKDPVVAEGRPDLAVKDEVAGGLWRDDNGAAWVNAFYDELWQANADFAVELAELGFDEIQYDYIRFPSDGDLRTADFGQEYTEEARRAAITGAVKLGADRVRPTGAKFAVDLFPIVAIFGNDQGIGQTVQDLTPLVDYVCLMVYPSHYEEGNIPVDGHPNDFPAATVTYTLEATEELVPGTRAKMRPWLQDFTYPLAGYSEYGPAEVRAQIDAAEAEGVSGWMLWNAAGQFEVAALRAEP